jgi:CubicO group peptidase (beta-lactamase class C family)
MKTKPLVTAIVLTLLLTSCAQAVAAPTPDAIHVPFDSTGEAVYPGESWQWAESPEEVGWSSAKLDAARAFSERLGSAAVMIVDDGIVVDAWGDITQNYICHSMRKSLISGLYGIYVAEGKIDISETLEELGIDDHAPLTEEEKQATVADLLKARSGIYIPAVGESAGMKASRPERRSHEPGTFWYYNNWDFNALGTIFDQETGERSIYEAFKKRIAEPIGMQDFVTGNLQYDYEPYSMHPYYGFLMSARDLARFGLLFARRGRWGNEQIIPEAWVAESTTSYSDAGASGGYGYMWWIAANGNHLPNVALPDGSFSARGHRGHYVLVIPEWDIVIVHRFDTFTPTGQVSDSEFGYLVRLILQAGSEGLDLGIPNAAEGIELSEAELGRFVGQYGLSRWTKVEGFSPPSEVDVELYGGNLVVLVPGEALCILVPITPNRFRMARGRADYVEFDMEGDRVKTVTATIDNTIEIVYEAKD